jgi:hypothetical protein
MSRNIHRLPEKDRRKERRRNHVAHDLGSRKYQQRVIPNKKKNSFDDFDYGWDDDYNWLKDIGLTSKE